MTPKTIGVIAVSSVGGVPGVGLGSVPLVELSVTGVPAGLLPCEVTLLLNPLAAGVGRITTLKLKVALAFTARLEPAPVRSVFAPVPVKPAFGVTVPALPVASVGTLLETRVVPKVVVRFSMAAMPLSGTSP